MRRIFAQARKELTQVTRDRLGLTLALVLPLVLLLLMSTAISLNVRDMPLVVQDYDNSVASRNYIDAFRGSLAFRVIAPRPNTGAEAELTANRARAVLIIPEGFGRDMARAVSTPVQIVVDATDTNTARLVQGYSSQITSRFLQTQGATAGVGPVVPQIRFWYNPGRESRKFYAPGIFVLGISMFPPLLAALAMSKEGEQKTILQVYVSSISAHEFLLGKVLAFMVIALCEWVLCFIALVVVFGMSIAGDPTPLLVASILYAFCVSCFGTMIGAAIPNQAAAIQAVALGGFLLVFLLSGLIYPVENIPAGLRWISNIVWGRYYIAILRDALLQGGGWPAVWFGVVMIGAIGSFFYLIAWRKLRAMQVNA